MRAIVLRNVPVIIVVLGSLCFGRSSFSQEAGRGVPAEREVPQGFGQLEHPPAMFKGGVDGEGRTFFLYGQPATNGKLIFTASNGFFDPGTCVATGKSDFPKVGDQDLIAPNFAKLEKWKQTGKSIRWHVWIAKPGTVYFDVRLQVDCRDAGSELDIAFAGQNRRVQTVPVNAGAAQPWRLEFEVAEAGEKTFTMSATRIANRTRGVGALFGVDVYGSAIEDARLLRARWRPAAVHGRYTSSQLRASRTWVMATRSTCDASSYSPITTPFGYYGTSFDARRRSRGTFNFSMWASGRRGAIPALEAMPHLLAAGSPTAEFSGFGHEGSGVKIRSLDPPMPNSTGSQ